MKTEKINLLPHYRKALTKLSKINNPAIRIKSDYCFSGAFYITLFSNEIGGTNCFFSFFDWNTDEAIALQLEKALNAISTGTFAEIQKASKGKYS